MGNCAAVSSKSSISMRNRISKWLIKLADKINPQGG
nr:MAG TPA: hypothetical protein [Caudoviricetes sp.]